MASKDNITRRGRVIVLDQALVKSAVWISLGGAAKAVLLIFRCKCQIGKVKSKRERKTILNNGELIFTYEEALQDYGITKPKFARALDELIATGFLDVAQSGMGLYRSTTLYAVSDRWKLYGTANFITGKRPKPSIKNHGFKKGKKPVQRNISSNAGVNGSVNVGVNGYLIAIHTNVNGEKVKTLYKHSNNKWIGHQIA